MEGNGAPEEVEELTEPPKMSDQWTQFLDSFTGTSLTQANFSFIFKEDKEEVQDSSDLFAPSASSESDITRRERRGTDFFGDLVKNASFEKNYLIRNVSVLDRSAIKVARELARSGSAKSFSDGERILICYLFF